MKEFKPIFFCGLPWQVAKAVGEGCEAGLNAADYSKKLKS